MAPALRARQRIRIRSRGWHNRSPSRRIVASWSPNRPCAARCRCSSSPSSSPSPSAPCVQVRDHRRQAIAAIVTDIDIDRRSDGRAARPACAPRADTSHAPRPGAARPHAPRRAPRRWRRARSSSPTRAERSWRRRRRRRDAGRQLARHSRPGAAADDLPAAPASSRSRCRTAPRPSRRCARCAAPLGQIAVIQRARRRRSRPGAPTPR